MPRLEDDLSLLRERLHARWFIEEVMGGCDAGELSLIVGLEIRERWVIEHKASYGYELSWIFDRDRGTIRNVLQNLEERGEIERVDPNQPATRIFYKPTEEYEAKYVGSLGDDGEDRDREWYQAIHESCPCAKLKA